MAHFSSNVTYSTSKWTDADRQHWLREQMERSGKNIKELNAALDYKEIKERHDIWWGYFFSGDYEDVKIEVDFPELNSNWEYYIQKKLQKEIKDFIQK